MDTSVTLTIPAQITFLESVRVFARAFAQQLGASSRDAGRTEFIASELCANAIEYGKGPDSTVTLTLTAEPSHAIRIECVNSARRASVSAREVTRHLQGGLNARSTRGRGLFVIRSWTKDAAVQDTDGGLKISVVQSF